MRSRQSVWMGEEGHLKFTVVECLFLQKNREKDGILSNWVGCFFNVNVFPFAGGIFTDCRQYISIEYSAKKMFRRGLF